MVKLVDGLQPDVRAILEAGHAVVAQGGKTPDQMSPIFQGGLHEFLNAFIQRNNHTSALIAEEFHFQ